MRIKANPVVVSSLLTLFSCTSASLAADRFVSPTGNDSHSGTLSAPYKTLAKALEQASPGDTVYLREGRYHEVIDFSGINGNSNNPITITAYQGEEAVIDGSRSLSELGGATWVPLTDGGHPACLNNCYKTTINPDLFTAADGATDSEDGSVVQGIWQLWVANENYDGRYKMMIPARWPNYDPSKGHPSDPIRFKSDNRTPLDDSWWDMGGTWAFMKTSWVAQKDADYDSSVLTSKTLGYNLHHLDNNPAYHDLSDLPANDLGGNPLTFSGGSLILNYHSETQFSRNIEPDGHQAGTNRLTHRSVVDPHDQNTGYFMVEHKNALDQAGEWYYDKDSHEIWLWPEDGQDPTGKAIRGKTQSWAMDLTGSRHITLRGLTFFGTAIKCEQDCTDITIEDNQFLYPSWYPRMLGLHSYKGEDQLNKGDKAGSSSGEGSIRLKGKNYLIRNNVFAHSDAMIDMNGSNGCRNDNNHFINNLFHHWSYTGSAQMMILMNSNCNSSFVRNTMHTNGSKVMLKHGSVDVAWSHVSQFGYFQQDGTAFQCKGGNFEQGASNGTERHHIWAVDALKGLGRWDGNDGVGGVDHHQVAMNVAAHGNIKGDYHIVTNNTTVHPHQPSKTMFKLTSTSFMDEDKDGNPDLDENGLAMAAENAHSHLYNNASSGISSDPHIAVPLLIKPEYMAANWNGFGEVKTAPNFDPAAGPLRKGQFETRAAGDTVASRLRDPKNFDFRPKATATDLIDQGVEVAIPIIGLNNVAVPKGLGNIGDTLTLNDPIAGSQPDIGAYEYDVSNALEYWIPGYRHPDKATMAVPRNGTATAKMDADLMWLPAQNAVAHVVYLGASEDQLEEICRFEGESAFAQGRDTESLPALEDGFTHLKNICSPGALEPNQDYVWRVDTVDEAGAVTQGDVWQFGVGSPSKQVTTVLPAIEDTYIDENSATSNFANQRGMLLCTPDITSSSPNRLIYIKFDLSEIPGNITQATLRVKRSDGNGTTHDTGAYVVGNDWQDNQLTYETAESKGLIPEEGDRELAFVEKIYEGSWGDFTITEGIESGQQTLSVALKSHPSKSCGSRKLIEAIEAEKNSSKDLAPELVVVYEELTTSTVPQAVSDLSYTENGHSLTFDWTASPSNSTVGYNIYRRDHHEDSYQFPLNPSVLTSTQYIDTSLNAGQSYEYVVRAVNSEGIESPDTEVINVRLTDSDGDGMSDRWEQFYGLDPTVDDASLDNDADGVSNLDEYIAFSEPNDASVTSGNSELTGELSAVVASGGSISEVSAGNIVTFNVSNANVSDVMPVIAEWRQLSGPEINLTISGLDASFVAPEVGADSEVVVELVMARGNSYLTQTQTITIAGQGTVEPPVEPPTEPTLLASAVLTVNGEQTSNLSAGTTVTLDASNSQISDNSELAFLWTYSGNEEITLSGSDTAVATFTVPELAEDTVVTFDVTVSSGDLSQSVSITATIQKFEDNGGDNGGDNGTPTTPEVPSIQEPASGGGSLSYGAFVLILLMSLRRKRPVTQRKRF